MEWEYRDISEMTPENTVHVKLTDRTTTKTIIHEFLSGHSGNRFLVLDLNCKLYGEHIGLVIGWNFFAHWGSYGSGRISMTELKSLIGTRISWVKRDKYKEGSHQYRLMSRLLEIDSNIVRQGAKIQLKDPMPFGAQAEMSTHTFGRTGSFHIIGIVVY